MASEDKDKSSVDSGWDMMIPELPKPPPSGSFPVVAVPIAEEGEEDEDGGEDGDGDATDDAEHKPARSFDPADSAPDLAALAAGTSGRAAGTPAHVERSMTARGVPVRDPAEVAAEEARAKAEAQSESRDPKRESTIPGTLPAPPPAPPASAEDVAPTEPSTPPSPKATPKAESPPPPPPSKRAEGKAPPLLSAKFKGGSPGQAAKKPSVAKTRVAPKLPPLPGLKPEPPSSGSLKSAAPPAGTPADDLKTQAWSKVDAAIADDDGDAAEDFDDVKTMPFSAGDPVPDGASKRGEDVARDEAADEAAPPAAPGPRTLPAPSRYAQRPSAEALAPASPLLAAGAPALGSAGVTEAEPIPQAVSPQDTGALVADIAAELMAGSPSAASTGDGLRPETTLVNEEAPTRNASLDGLLVGAATPPPAAVAEPEESRNKLFLMIGAFGAGVLLTALFAWIMWPRGVEGEPAPEADLLADRTEPEGVETPVQPAAEPAPEPEAELAVGDDTTDTGGEAAMDDTGTDTGILDDAALALALAEDGEGDGEGDEATEDEPKPEPKPRRKKKKRRKKRAAPEPEPEPKPEPKAAPKPPPKPEPKPKTASELLNEAKRAKSSRQWSSAYSSANAAFKKGAGTAALDIMVKSACHLKQSSRAQSAYKKLPLTRRGDPRRYCRDLGIKL